MSAHVFCTMLMPTHWNATATLSVCRFANAWSITDGGCSRSLEHTASVAAEWQSTRAPSTNTILNELNGNEPYSPAMYSIACHTNAVECSSSCACSGRQNASTSTASGRRGDTRCSTNGPAQNARCCTLVATGCV